MNFSDSANTSGVMEKAQFDPAFFEAFGSDSYGVLGAYGNSVPGVTEIKVVRDAEAAKHPHVSSALVGPETRDIDLMDTKGGTTRSCLAGSVTLYFAAISAVGGTGAYD